MKYLLCIVVIFVLLHNNNNNNNNVQCAKTDNVVQVAVIGYMQTYFEQFKSFSAYQAHLINQRDDILPNVTLELHYYDTQTVVGGVGQAILLAVQAIQDGCKAFITGASTAQMTAVGSIAAAFNMPQVLGATTGAVLSNKATFPVTMRVIPADQYMCIVVAKYIRAMGWSNVAIFYSGDDYGIGNRAAFMEYADEFNIKVYEFQVAIGDTDMTAEVAALKRSRVRIVVFLTHVAEGLLILQELREDGMLNPDYVYFVNQILYNAAYKGTSLEEDALFDGTFGMEMGGMSGSVGNAFYASWLTANATLYPSTFFPRVAALGAAYYLAESVMTVALGLDKVLKEGGNVTNINGTAWYQAMVGLNYTGVTGPVSYDSNGDRIGDFNIFNGNTTTKWLLAKYQAVSGEFVYYRDPLYIGGRTDKPLDFPCDCVHGTCVDQVCLCYEGYQGSNCEFEKGSKVAAAVLVPAISVPVVIIIAITVAIAWIMYRRKRLQLVSAMKDNQKSVVARSDIKLDKFIGRGASGEVYSALFRGTKVAVKVLNTQQTSKKELQAIELESAIMCSLRHPNIVLFMGSSIDNAKKELLLIMEYMAQGSLHSVLNNKNIELPFRLQMHIALQSAQGINFLHQSSPPLIHCDIKSHNVFLDDKWSARIGDFGISKISKMSNKDSSINQGNMGTIFWTAPEVLSGELHSTKSDTYAFGVLLWEIFHRKDPYVGFDPIQVALNVIKVESRPEISKDVPHAVANLITSCWHQNPAKRPDFSLITATLREISISDNNSKVSKTNLGSGPTGTVFFVALEIENFFDLWEALPRAMLTASEIYMDKVKEVLTEHNGYEAIADIRQYLAAFSTLNDAINFSINLQLIFLNEVDWPVDFSSNKSSSTGYGEDGSMLWNGLRVKMAIHKGNPTVVQNDDSVTYSGLIVDKTLDLLDSAPAGVILASDFVSSMISKSNEELYTKAPFSGNMYVVAPTQLRERLQQIAVNSVLSDCNNLHTIMDIDTEGATPAAVYSRKLKNPSWLIDESKLRITGQLARTTIANLSRAVYNDKQVVIKTFFTQLAKEQEKYYIGVTCSQVIHPNVATYKGVIITATQFSIVMDYAQHGSLQSYLYGSTTTTNLSYSDKINIAKDIASGMKYINEHPDPLIRCHKNLKSSNILVNSSGSVQITDYGLNSLYEEMRTLTSIGLVQWSAPELFEGAKHSTSTSVYSFGIILYEIYTRKAPYSASAHPIRLIHQIQQGFRPELPSSCPNEYKQLVENCWAANPADRPTWDNVLSSLTYMH